MSKANARLIFLFSLLVIFGIVLRIWGVGFGLPSFHYADEDKYLTTAMLMWAHFDFNPHYFQNPPLLTYIYAFAIGCFFIACKILGFFASPQAFGRAYLIDSTNYYIIARIISTLFGAGTCIVVYQIGKKLYNRITGVIAGIFLCFCFLHVRNSHYAVNDIAGVFFLVLAFKYIVNIYTKGNTKDYILAGLLSGLAIATKYNMGIIIFSIPVAHYISLRSGALKNTRKLLFAFLLCFLGFFIVCPWILLDFKSFFKGFFAQLQLAREPWFGGSHENSYLQFMKTLIWGYGLIPLLLSIVGVISLMKERSKLLLIAFFSVLYFLVMGKSRLFFARFTLPVVPFLCIFSAAGLMFIAEYISHRKKIVVVTTVLLLAILQGLIFSLRHDYLISKTDTRIIARDWIKENVPPGSKILIETYGPNLKDFKNGKPLNGYQVKGGLVGQLPQKSIKDYKREGYEYIVTSSFVSDRYTRSPEIYKKEIDFYASLDIKAEEIFSVTNAEKKVPFFLEDMKSPFWNLFVLRRPGPRIKVYLIK